MRVICVLKWLESVCMCIKAYGETIYPSLYLALVVNCSLFFQASSPTSWPTRSSAGPTTRSWVSSSWPLRCPLSRCPCTPIWSSGSGSALTGPSLRPPSGARYDYKLSLVNNLTNFPIQWLCLYKSFGLSADCYQYLTP